MPEWAGMRTASKTSALVLILFIALSSLTVLAAEPANAQMTQPPLNSSWSSIQTVTSGEASAPSWSSPTCESPALPAWSWLIALSLLVAAILIAVVLRYRTAKPV